MAVLPKAGCSAPSDLRARKRRRGGGGGGITHEDPVSPGIGRFTAKYGIQFRIGHLEQLRTLILQAVRLLLREGPADLRHACVDGLPLRPG